MCFPSKPSQATVAAVRDAASTAQRDAEALFSRQSDAAYVRTGEVRSKLKANKQSATAVAVLDAAQDVVIERGSVPLRNLSLADLQRIVGAVDLLVVAASK